MKIAICDDEVVFQQELKDKLEKYYNSLDVLIQGFTTGEALVKSFEKDRYDLIFLDIEMDGMDGFTTARLLKEQQSDITVIFLTGHTEMAMEGYEVQAFRFLAKPIEQDRLYSALRAFGERFQTEKKVVISENGKQRLIRCREIKYIKSENVYLQIVTEKEEYWVRKKQKELLEELPKDYFVAVHRSHIVNMEYVKCFGGNEIILEGETKIPVSRGKRDLFKQQMMKYMKEKQ
ncbi:MAG: response regulator transcription factor [Lachnospiraceae bacterium]|nr:response regulator transcription factor [Lachnospiraceae bacterium]